MSQPFEKLSLRFWQTTSGAESVNRAANGVIQSRCHAKFDAKYSPERLRAAKLCKVRVIRNWIALPHDQAGFYLAIRPGRVQRSRNREICKLRDFNLLLSSLRLTPFLRIFSLFGNSSMNLASFPVRCVCGIVQGMCFPE